MLQQVKKRTRATHAKVRTGCHTCKVRRVKCDEQRPACQKCLTTGRTCEGYNNDRQWIIMVPSPHPPAATAPPLPPLPQPPPSPPPMLLQPSSSPADQDASLSSHHLDYFRTTAVHELCWFPGADADWGRRIVRYAQSSPPIRHAAIALACSHQSSRSPQESSSATLIGNYYYGRAIRALVSQTYDNVPCNRGEFLVCGLMFISIETLRGNRELARYHLEGCLKIVRETREGLGLGFVCLDQLPGERERLSSEAWLLSKILCQYLEDEVGGGRGGEMGE
ncbi:hypothetical protein BU24DRAFT_488718 [Aaosphaeria arxii CBS 175.79]|uniref:Zn(2)-C6 fungal-type domain-containing protein n=1 Tax=Aaosphaeria arxii CBS 175.79 TaxID=1450172 RepID=A0A6A5Y080_9PLEO|nr:uncharacterized protein BU24DRAFT_488718 [Aaosphaeria arxii CBS 175.79]KAF2018626.1 hypothetical protein BU24DRAFT_488718 [Aaosphaeria arxii CBS 175.79]